MSRMGWYYTGWALWPPAAALCWVVVFTDSATQRWLSLAAILAFTTAAHYCFVRMSDAS